MGELAIMMNLKRRDVEETVKEGKADELSAMFTMIVEQKRRLAG